jgi:hypothetical protein
MLFLECRSKATGSPSQRLTYEIPGEIFGSGQKQRNVPVWSILGHYSQAGKTVGIVNCIDTEPKPETSPR